ncbi:MAG: pilin [Candidatus Saccharimonadales bacterium]|nr:pilin [Candidatus Saccharimonadales bacterium]
MLYANIKYLRIITTILIVLGLGLIGAADYAAASTSEKAACEGAQGTWNASTSQCDFGPDAVNVGGDTGVLRTATNILLFIVGAAAVIVIIINGIRMVVSGGDPQAVANARQGIIYGVVGVIVAFLAYALVAFVADEILNPDTPAEEEGNGGNPPQQPQ